MASRMVEALLLVKLLCWLCCCSFGHSSVSALNAEGSQTPERAHGRLPVDQQSTDPLEPVSALVEWLTDSSTTSRANLDSVRVGPGSKGVRGVLARNNIPAGAVIMSIPVKMAVLIQSAYTNESIPSCGGNSAVHVHARRLTKQSILDCCL